MMVLWQMKKKMEKLFTFHDTSEVLMDVGHPNKSNKTQPIKKT